MNFILDQLPALRVLIVIGVSPTRHQAATAIQQLGHEAIQVSDAKEAAQHVSSGAVDLALMNVDAGSGDVQQQVAQLREACSETWLPLIVLSAFQDERQSIRAIQAGADDYLVTPVNPELLGAKLRQYQRMLSTKNRLKLLADRHLSIYDSLLDSVISIDANGRIEDANLAAQRLFSTSDKPLKGLLCSHALGASEKNFVSGGEVSLTRVSGESFPAEVSVSDWTDKGLAWRTLVIRDLSERHRLDRMKDEFMAAVSHELRTPLTSVLGALRLLSSGAVGAIPKSAQTLIEVATRNGVRLGSLIDDVLDLTKLEANRMHLQLRSVDVGSLVRESLLANQNYAQQGKVTLVGRGVDEVCRIDLDAERFLQVMANLLSNAIKYSKSGDEVQIQMVRLKSEVQISVKDQGPGIHPEFRNQLFEKFSQDESAKHRAQGGTGLGLYITRMFVERMGGEIGVESEPGRGATFTVRFPIAPSPQASSVPLILHIDHDFGARERLNHWLSPVYEVASHAGLGQLEAATLSQRRVIVIADPTAQGSAEAFCRKLLQFTDEKSVLLFTDSVDDEFVRNNGLHWLRKNTTQREDLLGTLRKMREDVTK